MVDLFQVKRMITSYRVAAVLVLIFLLVGVSVSPVYIVNRLDLVVLPGRNKTVIGLVHTDNRESVERPAFAVNNVVVPQTAFLVIIICTGTLVTKLRQKTRWRAKSVTSVQVDNSTSRDTKVTKMVVIISSLFIVCFIPVSITFIAMTINLEFSVDGKYQNINLITIGIGLLLESINSASNIFIYYNMSSRYQAVFRQVFCVYGCQKHKLQSDAAL